MGVFERYLTIWVGGAISVGVGLGSFFPVAFAQVAEFEYAGVNFVVAILIWVMTVSYTHLTLPTICSV